MPARNRPNNEGTRTGRALRASERRYRELYEAAPVPILEEDWSGARKLIDDARTGGVKDLRRHFRANPEFLAQVAAATRVLAVNPAALEMYGACDEGELLEWLNERLRTVQFEGAAERIAALAEGRTRVTSDYTSRRFDGAPFDSRIAITIPASHEADWSRVLVVIEDITEQRSAQKALKDAHDTLERCVRKRTAELEREVAERKQVEKALRESGQQMRLLTDALPAFISYVDAERRYRFVNKTYETTFDRPREEMIGQRVEDVIGSDAHRAVAPQIAAALAGETVTFEFENFFANHGPRHLRATYVPDLRAGGEVAGFFVLAQDMTERKRVEEALRESESRYRRLIEFLPDIVFTHSEGVITFVNAAGARMLGADSADQIVGRPIRDIVHPDEWPEAAGRIKTVVEERIPAPNVERRYVRMDGGIVPVEVGAIPFADHGKPGVLAIARDITERKASEERLRQAQRMEALGALAGSLAHDFNNILTVTTGNLELLVERLAGNGRLKKLAGAALGAALRGAALTDRLLSFSRVQALEPENVDLGRLVADMAELMGKALGESIEIRTTKPKRLWKVLAVASQVENAIVNLAINARDAMPRGGTLTIEMANARMGGESGTPPADIAAGEYVTLAVTDTGEGMAPDIVARAFEPFFTTKAVGRGSGLGLSMVYGFAKQSGGVAAIDSEPGRGTTVILYLPRVKSAAAPSARGAAPRATRATGETILVVEDDDAVRDVTVARLRNLGYRIEEAGSGRQALRTLERGQRVDLLFSDVVMAGGMSGLDLVRETRQRWPGLKVLLTSSYAEEVIAEDDSRRGRIALLRKPYRGEELARMVRVALTDEVTEISP